MTQVSQSNYLSGYIGSLMAVSSNGSKSPILWSLSNKGGGLAILRAFNGANLNQLYWDSEMSPINSVGGAYYFVPTVANGKVDVATTFNKIKVYGVVSSPYPSSVASRPPFVTPSTFEEATRVKHPGRFKKKNLVSPTH